MDATSHAFLGACPFRSHENPYEQTKTIWSNWAGQKSETVADPLPLTCSQPIPLALLQQWKYYFAFCSGIVAQKVDWRDVFVYMSDASPAATLPLSLDSSSAATAAMMEGAADHVRCDKKNPLSATASACRRSVMFLMNKLAGDCERRFGACALRFHHQWLLRWTKMLAQCITWRLSHVSKKGESVPLKELRCYRFVFASRAKEVLGAEAYVRVLLEHLEAEEKKELQNSCSAEDVASLSLTQTAALTLTLTMTFTPLRVTFLSLAQCFPALSARALESLWADDLCIPCNVLNPHRMPEQVRRRVVASLNDTHGDIDGKSALAGSGGCRIHSATLGVVLEDGNPVRRGSGTNPILGIVAPEAGPLQLVKPHQLPSVVYLLETVGYVMLTKLRCSLVEKCYYALPFLADFVALGALLKKALLSLAGPSAASASTLSQAGSFTEALSMGLTPMLLQALLEATEDLYARAVDGILNGYSSKTMKHVVEFCGRSGTDVVSRAVVGVLERVVEPTLEVLLLLFGHDFSSKDDWHLVDFVVNMLKAVLNEKMEEMGSRCRSAPLASLQCHADHALLINYIDEHPLLQQRASVM
ncbi:uncharacterized protein Tco025E_01422 [Trypanosoma conorhini]|uniref:Uncharacterized protein n=1 Tax=Trypanosoma conorhini TaxID=83891 RepID=A0A3R7LKS1_9TRYP|nr:uncharacterized protein Tco025E_01422 [Trypanosoma conorhini]RNF26630.1 hypothetical protein Tco025E_01422 [Trypanosoma conorhini]